MQEIAERAGREAVQDRTRKAMAVVVAGSPMSMDVHVPLVSDRKKAERTD